MEKTKDMTTGKPIKLLLMFAMPLMLGNIFQQLYSVIAYYRFVAKTFNSKKI